MSKLIYYINKWMLLALSGLLFTGLAGCGSGQKKMDERITFTKTSKLPYGVYAAHEWLPYVFPNAEITFNKKSFTDQFTYANKKAFIILTPQMDPDPSEITRLVGLASEGNHVFISTFYFGDSLLNLLDLKVWHDAERRNDSLTVSIYHPVTGDSLSFSYPGFRYDSYFSGYDTVHTSILGKDIDGHPNMVRFTYKGGGSLILQLAPLTFSNFFLLHKNNRRYFESTLSYIPNNVQEVIWDEYFRVPKTAPFSSLGFLSSVPSLRWALLLLLLLIALLYIFESKRKQRIVPVIEGLRNDSLDFVKTIGRLYYQRRDNLNLSAKIVAHFQDHVRTRYNINAQLSDPELAGKLAYRTDLQKEFLQQLITDMYMLLANGVVSDEELLSLNQRMEQFYKHA